MTRSVGRYKGAKKSRSKSGLTASYVATYLKERLRSLTGAPSGVKTTQSQMVGLTKKIEEENTMSYKDTPLSDRQVFPVYNTPELYKEATGVDAPLFVMGMKPKYWFDPEARERAKTAPTDLFEYLVVATGKDGKPYLKMIEMEAVDAGSVNIPSYADGIMDATGQIKLPRVKVPDPIKPLQPGEELVEVPTPVGPKVVIRNTTEYLKLLEKADTFLAADRVEIRSKLDQVLQLLTQLTAKK